MNKITVKTDGMMCGMCEAHLCDAIRRAFSGAKRVRASRKSGELTFLSEKEIDGDALRSVISKTGYGFVSVSSQPYEKHGPFK